MKSNREEFIKWLEKQSKESLVIGEFKNDFGESFIIYVKQVGLGAPLYITGDELDWEKNQIWSQGRFIGKPGEFVLSIEETIQALQTLLNYTKKND